MNVDVFGAAVNREPGRAGVCVIPISQAQFDSFPYAVWTMENRVDTHLRGRIKAQGYAVRVRYSDAANVYEMELACTSILGFTLKAHPADFERVKELILKEGYEK